MDKMEGLRPRRIKAGLSQKELGQCVGVSRQSIIAWESGAAWPTAQTLPLLAETLGCSVDALYRAPEEGAAHGVG
jgi:transcriptional regulator with XRE-family HTH domain